MNSSATILRPAALLVAACLAAPAAPALAQSDNWLSRLFQPPPSAAVPASDSTADDGRGHPGGFCNGLLGLWLKIARSGINRVVRES
jgi:hypothetical protein